ncbi:MAG: cell division/cell wall cluster transcriptional repressor MraZ [Phycisphaerae bacterium]|nr:cell division/cell wall cluster transcriptional repressor MraZ [Phycisphaerae bacterium]
MSLLVGEYECTLDAKNRLMVPADFRRELDRGNAGSRWYAILHLQDRLWLMPEDEFAREVAKIRPTLLPKDEQLDFVRALFSRSQVIEPDKQGRVVLPEKLLLRAKLGKDVTLVGMGRYVEVNDRAAWLAEQQRANFDESFRKARQAGIEVD